MRRGWFRSAEMHNEETMNKEDLIGYAQDLLRLAMYKLDGTDAEDLVQETMLAALLAIEQGREIKNPKAWLQGILRRKYYDFLRQKYRLPTVSIDMLGDGSYRQDILQEDEQLRRLERSEEAETLRRELALQARIYREVLVRYYMHGESVGHIAQALNIPLNTVKSRLHAGREHIRKDFTMEKYTKQSYEPETLNVGISGECGMGGEPFSLIQQDRIKMNLMILAYDKPVTLRELSEAIGIAAAYIEPIVEQLVNGELMKRTGDKVYTDFIIYREADRRATVELQRELADRRGREIWAIVEQGLQKLREQDFYLRQREEARRKLESQSVIYILENAECSVRSEITGEIAYSSYPDRPNGGKWFALGNHFEAGYDAQKTQQEYRKYWIDGETSQTMGEYDGRKNVTMYAYDCLLGSTYHGCSQWGISEDMLLKILYLVAYDREKDLALLNSHILEHMDVLLELRLLARGEGGHLECLVPVISGENSECQRQLACQYGEKISQEFHDELLALLKYPVKLPSHLKSVSEWYRYFQCGRCFSMMVAQRARESGLFLPGYDGPAPAISLVEK